MNQIELDISTYASSLLSTSTGKYSGKKHLQIPYSKQLLQVFEKIKKQAQRNSQCFQMPFLAFKMRSKTSQRFLCSESGTQRHSMQSFKCSSCTVSNLHAERWRSQWVVPWCHRHDDPKWKVIAMQVTWMLNQKNRKTKTTLPKYLRSLHYISISSTLKKRILHHAKQPQVLCKVQQ